MELPPINVQNIEVELTADERALYEQVMNR
jgi:hypothetical protein